MGAVRYTAGSTPCRLRGARWITTYFSRIHGEIITQFKVVIASDHHLKLSDNFKSVKTPRSVFGDIARRAGNAETISLVFNTEQMAAGSAARRRLRSGNRVDAGQADPVSPWEDRVQIKSASQDSGSFPRIYRWISVVRL